MVTASSLCKKEGVKSIKELSEITETATSTLNDMFNKYPRRFEIMVIGAGTEKKRIEKKLIEEAEELVKQSEEKYKKQCLEGVYLVDQPITLNEAIDEIRDSAQ